MTAPVITQPKPEKIAMTAPVVTEPSADTMQFVLPFEYTTFDQIPKPLHKSVRIRAVPERLIASSSFSGWYQKQFCIQRAKDVLRQLRKDKLIRADTAVAKDTEDDVDMNKVDWSVAQYHPPFTLPFLRRNEVWISLDQISSDELKEMVKHQQQEGK